MFSILILRKKIKINTDIKINDRDKETINSNHCKRNHDLHQSTYKKRQASDILTSRDQSSVTTAASQKNNCLSDTGRNEELPREPRPPVSTNKDNRINARPNFDRVPKSTNRSERGPLTDHR